MDICIDLDHLSPGQFFIPVNQKGIEGRSLIPKAIQKGARILDVDLWSYAKKYRQKLTCPVILVTGTTGKSTTKNRISAILSQQFVVQSSQDTLTSEWAAPLAILQADSTTDILIIEVEMQHKEAFNRLVSLIRPTHVVVTNIGPSQLDFFKNQRAVALHLAQAFRPKLAWEQDARYAFLNHSTPYYDLLKQKADKQTFSVFPFKGETGLDQNLNLCQLVGRHFGISAENIQKGLFSAEPVTYQPQFLSHMPAMLIADVDHADPLSVAYALTYLSRSKGRKILVFGGMPRLGAKSKQYHHAVIDQALDATVSLMFTFGELTRDLHSEDLNITHFERKESLIKSLLTEIKSGDVILVKAAPEHHFSEIAERIKN